MPTGIEWTDETWNPVRARLRSDPAVIGWHCEHKSPGCEHCYSESRNLSGRCNLGTKLPFKPGHRKDVEIFLDERALIRPQGWRRPRMIFVCSMTDLFADFVPDEMIDRIFAVMALCPQHTFQVLTKRADRMRAYLTGRRREDHLLAWSQANPFGSLRITQHEVEAWLHPYATEDHRRLFRATHPGFPLRNVWLGVSVEDQARADERIPDLLATPAAVRFLSCEPLLGPVTFEGRFVDRPDPAVHVNWLEELDWIICGGESGKGARPIHPDWARSLRDQCAATSAPFFFKQHGEWIGVPDLRRLPGGEGPGFGRFDHCRHDMEAECVRIGKKAAGRLLDGVEHNGMPANG